jgi:hypothetical protein
MPDPAKEPVFSLSEETWHLIQARRRKADWRRQRAIARLVKPDADKLAAINTRHALERLAAYAIPALEEILYPSHLASFLQSLDAERRFLLDEITPIMSEHIRSVFGSGPAANLAFRCKLLIDAYFNRWESEAHLRVAELLRHSQVQIAGIMRLGISRLTLDTESETGQCPAIEETGVDNAPDSARGKINTAQAERAKTRQAFVDPKLERRDWSIYKWAEKSDVDPKTASDYLNGKKATSEKKRSRLAESLGESSIPE